MRKYLRFFRLVYGIQEPFDILLDAGFLTECFKYKIEIYDRLAKLLQCSEVRLYALRSTLKALQSGSLSSGEAHQFVISRCKVVDDDHLTDESPSLRLVSYHRKVHEEYLNSQSKTKVRRYFVATQDGDVRTSLRMIPGVPLIYTNKVTLVLEPPSEASRNFNLKVIEAEKTRLNDNEKVVVEKARYP